MYRDVRVCFEKKGMAVFISHLDLNRAIMRALLRSKLNIWLSEGFNPHPKVVFAGPLSLGYEGQYELFDFKADDDLDISQLNQLKDVMPPGISIKEIYFPGTKFKEICFAEYKLNIDCDKDKAWVNKLFECPVMVEKKTKRSQAVVDIREFIHKLDIKDIQNGVEIETILDFSAAKMLSPSYIITALTDNGAAVDDSLIIRKGFLDCDFKEFK
jgi:radical SAM-linked protein